MSSYDYTFEEIVSSLKQVGLKKTDSIFTFSNLGFFGKLKNSETSTQYCEAFKDAIFEIIGSKGTLVVPTFSYSFCNNNQFDVLTSPSVCGIFSEYIMKDNQSMRSNDPNFSITAIGENAEYFTKQCTSHSFGKGSFWERYLKKNGNFCNFNFDSGSSFFHYVEKLLNVPYRFDKEFKGLLKVDGKYVESVFVHFVYDKEKPENGPDFEKFHKRSLELKKTKTANLGKGQIVCISAKDTLDLIKNEILSNPNFLIKGITT
jgi:aminoglycoside 3-N-acetyltransferase